MPPFRHEKGYKNKIVKNTAQQNVVQRVCQQWLSSKIITFCLTEKCHTKTWGRILQAVYWCHQMQSTLVVQQNATSLIFLDICICTGSLRMAACSLFQRTGKKRPAFNQPEAQKMWQGRYTSHTSQLPTKLKLKLKLSLAIYSNIRYDHC